MATAIAITQERRRVRSRRGLMRRRRVRTMRLLALLLVLIGVLVAAPKAVYMMDRSAAVPTIEYTVAPGDTLWDIAARYSGEDDPRRVVRVIRKANRLQSATIYPGQVLVIPQPVR